MTKLINNIGKKSIIKIQLFLFCFFTITNSVAQRDFSDSKITKVVLLGTGNPNTNPERSGPSIAIIVNDEPYIVDFGPGLIRKASAMSPRYGGSIKGLSSKNIKHAFLTHMHSDHTTGYPDLILTPWVMGRDTPLEVYGPEGIDKMTKYILKAYEDDINYRLYGLEPANNQGWRVNSHEILKEGLVFKDNNVKVEAFPVPHGAWPNAWGYRFTTPDKVIIISGDTSPSEKLIEYAKNADILIHEVYPQKKFDELPNDWKKYHSKNHTSTLDLGRIANEIQPKILILSHVLFWGASEKDILNEIKTMYQGKVIVGQDLDTF